MKKPIWALAAAGMLMVTGMAVAHNNGHEIRTVAGCNQLGPKVRQACKVCVKRPHKHHYHPDYPVGQRCRPDNGKP